MDSNSRGAFVYIYFCQEEAKLQTVTDGHHTFNEIKLDHIRLDKCQI